jgi:hypothetical protein
MTPYNASDMIRSIHQTYGLPATTEDMTESHVRFQRWLASLIHRRQSPEGNRPK